MKNFIYLFIWAVPLCAAAIDPVFIGQNYATGVVKIILYDHGFVDDFNLSDDQGQLSRGSGFFVSPEGLIFTNRHVIEWCVKGYVVADWIDNNGKEHKTDILTYVNGMEKDPSIKRIYYAGHTTPVIQVFRDHTQTSYDLYLAEVVAFGENFDGAIVKVSATLKGDPLSTHFNGLPLGNSDTVVLGEKLVILGYPSQYTNSNLSMDLRDTLTLSQGADSGWDYIFDPDWGMIKTDAAIHEGNSGGPVFGTDNKVIGIATALGVQTDIGLIGPINIMYLLAKQDDSIFDSLSKKGLTKPGKEGHLEIVSGKPQKLPFDPEKYINPLTNQPVKDSLKTP